MCLAGTVDAVSGRDERPSEDRRPALRRVRLNGELPGAAPVELHRQGGQRVAQAVTSGSAPERGRRPALGRVRVSRSRRGCARRRASTGRSAPRAKPCRAGARARGAFWARRRWRPSAQRRLGGTGGRVALLRLVSTITRACTPPGRRRPPDLARRGAVAPAAAGSAPVGRLRPDACQDPAPCRGSHAGRSRRRR
jgi:hypothetical protein